MTIIILFHPIFTYVLEKQCFIRKYIKKTTQPKNIKHTETFNNLYKIKSLSVTYSM